MAAGLIFVSCSYISTVTFFFLMQITQRQAEISVITMTASTATPTTTPMNTYKFTHDAPVLVGELIRASLVIVPEKK